MAIRFLFEDHELLMALPRMEYQRPWYLFIGEKPVVRFAIEGQNNLQQAILAARGTASENIWISTDPTPPAEDWSY